MWRNGYACLPRSTRVRNICSYRRAALTAWTWQRPILIAREALNRRAMGGRLYLHRVKEATRETLKRGGYRDEIGGENIFTSRQEAIANIFERLGHDICSPLRQTDFYGMQCPTPTGDCARAWV